MADKIQIRGGTASEWVTANPILSPRELGIETDTGRAKSGDGVSSWADLPYFITPRISEEINVSYTVVLLDDHQIIERNNASANETILPAGFPTGFAVGIVQTGAGVSTIKVPDGVTLNGIDGGSTTISNQFSSVQAYVRASNEWILIGDRGAVS